MKADKGNPLKRWQVEDEERKASEAPSNAGEPTPEIDALIDGMLHRNGIPRCDEWDVIVGCARTLEIEKRELVEALKEAMKLVHPQDFDFAPRAVAILSKVAAKP